MCTKFTFGVSSDFQLLYWKAIALNSMAVSKNSCSVLICFWFQTKNENTLRIYQELKPRRDVRSQRHPTSHLRIRILLNRTPITPTQIETYRSRPAAEAGKWGWWMTSSWPRRTQATGAWRSAAAAWNRSTPWARRQRSAGRTVFGSWSVWRASGSDPSGWARRSCSGGIPRGSGCYRTGAKALERRGRKWGENCGGCARLS